MTKKNKIGQVAVGLAAAATLGFLGGIYTPRPAEALPSQPIPTYAQDPAQNQFMGQPFYDAVQRAESERLSHPSAVENRLASRGVTNVDAMLDIVSGLYEFSPGVATQLDNLTERLTDSKKFWQGVGVYGLPSSAFSEGDLDIDTGLKEWYGGKERRQLWMVDYSIGQAKKNPGKIGPGGLERLLEEQSFLRSKIFGQEEPLLTEDDLQGMLNEQIRDGKYNDK